jgi:hypothetical protein
MEFSRFESSACALSTKFGVCNCSASCYFFLEWSMSDSSNLPLFFAVSDERAIVSMISVFSDDGDGGGDLFMFFEKSENS